MATSFGFRTRLQKEVRDVFVEIRAEADHARRLAVFRTRVSVLAERPVRAAEDVLRRVDAHERAVREGPF